MGIGFVLLVYLVALTIITFPFAAFFSFQKWIRKDLGRTSRFIRIYFVSYSWFLFGVIGMGMLSSLQGYDIGFGDFWERKISERFSVCSIDSPYSMKLCKDDSYLNADKFVLKKEVLIVKINDSTKCYNSNTGSTVSCHLSQDQLDFVTPNQFYDQRITQRAIASAIWLVFDFCIALFVAITKDRFKYTASRIIKLIKMILRIS